MKKQILSIAFALMVGTMVFTACGNSGNSAAGASQAPQQSAENTENIENQMQYITKEDLKTDVDAGGSGYVILDVRKVADYDEKHIKGAYSADVDPSISGEDNETSTANLKAGQKEATGSETGNADTQYVLVCYSGKKYAQKATDLLIEMGVPSGNIYTLEGGNNGWAEGGDDYTSLME